jgi:hypothetical protein
VQEAVELDRRGTHEFPERRSCLIGYLPYRESTLVREWERETHHGADHIAHRAKGPLVCGTLLQGESVCHLDCAHDRAVRQLALSWHPLERGEEGPLRLVRREARPRVQRVPKEQTGRRRRHEIVRESQRK